MNQKRKRSLRDDERFMKKASQKVVDVMCTDETHVLMGSENGPLPVSLPPGNREAVVAQPVPYLNQ